MTGNEADSEGLYRFPRNEHVDPMDVLESHTKATAERMAFFDECAALHDTTEFARTDRDVVDELGPLSQGRRGFFAHVSMGVTTEKARLPLGVLGLTVWERHEKNEENANANTDTPDADKSRKNTHDKREASHKPRGTMPQPFSEMPCCIDRTFLVGSGRRAATPRFPWTLAPRRPA